MNYIVQFQWVIVSTSFHWGLNVVFLNLNWSGGQIDPLLLYIIFCCATAPYSMAIFKTYLLKYSVSFEINFAKKSDYRVRGHVTFRSRVSAQNLTKQAFSIRLCAKQHIS